MTMRNRFLREVAATGLPAGTGTEDPVTEAQLAALPEPVQRYLWFMGVVGRPRDWSFRLGFSGRFRRKPGEAWMKCEAWQYNSRLAVARIFHIRARFGGLFPVVARDTYVQGRGRMLIKLLDLYTIEDGVGEEFDIGEMVTYLDDAVLIAPSMLLVPEVAWAPVDTTSFDVALTGHGRTVTARVLIDERGAPTPERAGCTFSFQLLRDSFVLWLSHLRTTIWTARSSSDIWTESALRGTSWWIAITAACSTSHSECSATCRTQKTLHRRHLATHSQRSTPTTRDTVFSAGYIE